MSRNSTFTRIAALTCAIGCFGFAALAEPNVVHTPQFEFTAAPDPIAADSHALPDASLDHAVFVVRDPGDVSPLAVPVNCTAEITTSDAILTACGTKETGALRSTIS